VVASVPKWPTCREKPRAGARIARVLHQRVSGRLGVVWPSPAHSGNGCRVPRPRPSVLRNAGSTGTPWAAAEKASQSWGATMGSPFATNGHPAASLSVLRLSDRITRQRVGSTQQLVLAGTRRAHALDAPRCPLDAQNADQCFRHTRSSSSSTALSAPSASWEGSRAGEVRSRHRVTMVEVGGALEPVRAAEAARPSRSRRSAASARDATGPTEFGSRRSAVPAPRSSVAIVWGPPGLFVDTKRPVLSFLRGPGAQEKTLGEP
jgi:hypothetical protein